MGRFVCNYRSRLGGGKSVEGQGDSTIILVDRHTGARKHGSVDHRRWRRDSAPLFSFQEEVELFLHLQAKGADWWPRETTTGELASLLLGLCARVEKVALDPLPGFGERTILGLASTGRRRFMRYLMGEDTAHPERKKPSGRETWRSAPSRLRRGRMGFAQSAARQ